MAIFVSKPTAMKTAQLIYYLDDDIDDLYFFKEIVEGMGHTATIFVNGKELLKALSSKEEAIPDIIFLDIHMPVFNGEEILQVIRKTEGLADVPIVMISGDYPKKLMAHYLDAGASYMMKKTQLSDLEVNLEQVLNIDWRNFQAFN